MKKNILHLQLQSIISGVQNVSITEIDGLKNRYNFTLACATEGPLTKKIRDLGAKVVLFPFLVRNINPLKDAITLFQMYTHLKRNRFDVVHTHSSKPGVLGRIAARLAGVSCIIHTVHGFPFASTQSKLIRIVYFFVEYFAARFNHVTVVMNDKDYLTCLNQLRIPPSRIVYVANGVSDHYFDNEFEKKTLYSSCNLIGEKFELVFVGRLSNQKNPLLILEAICHLNAEIRDSLSLTYIGDGELREQLELFCRQKSLNNIKFVGWLENPQEKLPLFDAFVLPSNYEGMPLSIIEAMALRLPVIASNVSGNSDLIMDNVTGLLFKSGDHIELSEKITLLLKNPKLRNLLADAAFAEASIKYRASVHCQGIGALYEG